jgi:predicted permease
MIPRLRIFAAKLKGLLNRRQIDFDDEMEAHLGLLTERLVRQGMTPEDAAWTARRQFGNLTSLQEKHREMQIFPSLEALWRDVRYGVRQLRLSPLFTVVAALSLALGIGANTAVFTLLDQLILRLLPVHEPERLVMIWSTGPHLGNNNGARRVSYPMYQDFQRKAAAFESVFCRYDTPLAVSFGGNTERAEGELVSGNYFQTLGVKPAMGRVFSPDADDQTYEGHPSVVLSYRYWLNRFAGDPNIVGRKILVNNYPMNVVGVSAPGFAGLDPSASLSLWVPIQMMPLMTPSRDDLGNRRSQWIQVFARLKPGYTVESARASLQPLFHQILKQELAQPELRKSSPYDRTRFIKRRVIVQTAANGYSDLREQYAIALLVLMCMAGLMLLIACSNVANLLIARAAARQKEIAVRLSLGAGRSTVIRQLLAESLLLSVTGAALGLLLSVVTTRALLHMLPQGAEVTTLRAEPDWRILLFSMTVALLTGLLFGLVPALQATRLDLWTTLKNAVSAVTGGNGSAKLRKALVVAQVALSFLLVSGAGLFVRTLSNLKNTDVGFKSIGDLATFQIDPSKNGYTVPRIHAFYTELLQDIQAAPGVTSAGFAWLPLLSGDESDAMVPVEGHEAKDGEDMQAYFNAVSPGYWKTMGVPLLQGRDFDEREPSHTSSKDQHPTAAIVNRKFAEHFFGTRNPIGRKVGFGGDRKPAIPIVGVVENSLYDGPRGGMRRQVFFPYAQVPVPTAATFYVRTTAEPAAMFKQLRGIVQKLDPSLPVYEMKTLSRRLDETLSTERMIASLSVAFGVLATVLAALGLYGVMAFVVTRRTKEIGLRMALGARQWSVLWLVLREVMVLLGVGLGTGIPCAYLLSRYVSSQLFGVTPTDLWTCAAAIAILGTAAIVSGFVPARRASTINPITALRYE